MFKRPEEIIVLILALLWVGLSYYFAAILISDAYTILLITVLTFVWVVICFLYGNATKPSYLAAVPRQPGCLLVAVLHLACKRRSRRHMVFRLDIQIHYRPDSRCCCLSLQVETEPKKTKSPTPLPDTSRRLFQTAFSISDITLRLSTIPIKCYTLHTI